MKSLRNIFTAIAIVISINVNAKWSNANLPSGVVYHVAIGPMTEPLPEETAARFNFMEVIEMPDRSWKYCAGAFTDYEEASIMENSIRFWGFENTEIVARFNKEFISIADAKTLQNNLNSFDEAMILGEVSIDEFGGMGTAFRYSVQVEMETYPDADNILETTYDMQLKVNNAGNFVYSVGQFGRIEEAREIRQYLSHQGVGNVSIVATFNGKRISTLAAANLQRSYEENMAEAVRK